MTKICKKFGISGKVQGVWFRSFAKKAAQKLDVTGWVKNSSNGNVEVLACGTEENIQQFEKLLWKGPLLARVKSITSEATNVKISQDFQIL